MFRIADDTEVMKPDPLTGTVQLNRRHPVTMSFATMATGCLVMVISWSPVNWLLSTPQRGS